MGISTAPSVSASVTSTLQSGSAVAGKFGIDQTTPGSTNLVEAANIPANIAVTPTVSTSPAYSSGDAVGGLQVLTGAIRLNAGTSLLRSITITDKGNQKVAFDIIFFNAAPTAPTDNAAYATLGTDIAKVVGRVRILTTDYDTVNSIGLASQLNIGLVMASGATQNLWAIVVTTGTPTYASTTDLTFTYNFEQN